MREILARGIRGNGKLSSRKCEIGFEKGFSFGMCLLFIETHRVGKSIVSEHFALHDMIPILLRPLSAPPGSGRETCKC